MIKSELIEFVGRKQDQLSEQDVAFSINAILEKMAQHLSTGGRIEIRGFGSFSLHYRPPRQAHNPKTGEKLVTPPKYAVHFKPGKELREKIDASKANCEIQHDEDEGHMGGGDSGGMGTSSY